MRDNLSIIGPVATCTILMNFSLSHQPYECCKSGKWSKWFTHMLSTSMILMGFLKFSEAIKFMELMKFVLVVHPSFPTCMSLRRFLKFPKVIKLMKLMKLVKG